MLSHENLLSCDTYLKANPTNLRLLLVQTPKFAECTSLAELKSSQVLVQLHYKYRFAFIKMRKVVVDICCVGTDLKVSYNYENLEILLEYSYYQKPVVLKRSWYLAFSFS